MNILESLVSRDIAQLIHRYLWDYRIKITNIAIKIATLNIARKLVIREVHRLDIAFKDTIVNCCGCGWNIYDKQFICIIKHNIRKWCFYCNGYMTQH